MTEVINLIFTILALIVAVVAGLWFGARLAESTRDERGRPRRTLSAALRDTTTKAAVSLWRWRRARAREADEK
jgi:hypothetical protein